MRINYFSDLHLEFGGQDLPVNDADIIVAAGDIGVFNQGVEWLKTLNKPVVYVAGNHEFYGNEYRQVLQRLRQECVGTQIRFLENEQFIFQGVRFLGCTLWADLYLEGLEKAEMLKARLNDFRRIQYQEQAIDPKVLSRLHHASRNWLQARLAETFAGKTVVVTHHAPTEWSWNDAPQAYKKLAYCNDLKALFHEFEINVWFHGHVHNQGDYRIADARILSNTRGYVGKRTVPDFDINKIVDI